MSDIFMQKIRDVYINLQLISFIVQKLQRAKKQNQI